MALMNKIMSGLISVAMPTGIWEKIIFAFNGGIKNYAWAIIILTLVIKLIMFPLDFFNRKFTRKNTVMQAEIAPELAVLQKKYGNDKNVMNQKQMELYKKHNFSPVGSCFFMIINLVLTLVVFFTLFNGLNTMADFKISQQYEDLKAAYNYTEVEKIDETIANENVVKKYDEIKDSWLWIDNIWLADSPLVKSIPSFDEYANIARLSKEERTEDAKLEYNKIMDPLRTKVGKENGYFILVILSVLFAVLQQVLANKKIRFKKKNILDNEVKAPNVPGNKVLMVVMPLMMGYFAFSFNAVFALYMVVSSIFGLITSPIINTIIDAMEKKSADKKKLANSVSYRRK
ncbi:MAG: YidC/Oxa1 family membrane protein insertase [Clostridia bacterium]